MARHIPFHRQLQQTRAYLRLMEMWNPSPRSRFVLFAQGRSGSTLLVSLLNNHPDVYCDEEIFHRKACGRIFFPRLYIAGCSRRSTARGKSIYGFKLKVYQLTRDQGIQDYRSLLDSLHTSGWRFIHLRRCNILKQSLSNQLYEAYGFSNTTSKDKVKGLKIVVNCDRLLKDIRDRIEFNDLEDEVLEEIPYVSVRYERDLLSPSYHQKTADRVFSHLGIESVSVKTQFLKLASDKVGNNIANFEEVCNRLHEAGFDSFLEEEAAKSC